MIRHPRTTGPFLKAYRAMTRGSLSSYGQTPPPSNATSRSLVIAASQRRAHLKYRYAPSSWKCPKRTRLVAQGQENNARLNTSFIERAIFAKRLNDRGMKIVRIADALSVVRSVILQVDRGSRGPARAALGGYGAGPGIGRARWQALAKRVASDADGWRQAIANSSFGSLSSDQRFERVATYGLNGSSAKLVAAARDLVDDRGCYMKVRRTAKAMTYAVLYEEASDRADGLTFADWLEKQIPSLREAYLKGR